MTTVGILSAVVLYMRRSARFPHKYREPAGRGADESAGGDVAQEVEVGAEQADDDKADEDGAERAPAPIAQPQHRHGRAHRRGVAGREGFVGASGAEEIKAVDAV